MKQSPQLGKALPELETGTKLRLVSCLPPNPQPPASAKRNLSNKMQAS